MSGGHFDYKQYHIEEITRVIEDAIRHRNDWYWDLSDATIEEMRRGCAILRRAAIYAHRIDWLLSGDDGEESFHERLAEDLKGCEMSEVLRAKIAELESAPMYRIEPLDIDRLIAEQDEENSRGGI